MEYERVKKPAMEIMTIKAQDLKNVLYLLCCTVVNLAFENAGCYLVTLQEATRVQATEEPY